MEPSGRASSVRPSVRETGNSPGAARGSVPYARRARTPSGARQRPYAVRADPHRTRRLRGFRAPGAGGDDRAAAPADARAGPRACRAATSSTPDPRRRCGAGGRPPGAGSSSRPRSSWWPWPSSRRSPSGSGRPRPPSGPQSPTPDPDPAADARRRSRRPTSTRALAPSVVLITTSKGSLGSGTVVTDKGTRPHREPRHLRRRRPDDHLRRRDERAAPRSPPPTRATTPPRSSRRRCPRSSSRRRSAAGSRSAPTSWPSATRSGCGRRRPSGIVSGLDRTSRTRSGLGLGAGPVRRGGQPGQLGRAAARRPGPAGRGRRVDRGPGRATTRGPGSASRCRSAPRSAAATDPDQEEDPRYEPGPRRVVARERRARPRAAAAGHGPARPLGQPAGAGPLRGQAHDRRAGRAPRADGRGHARRRARARRGRARPGQDAGGEVAGRGHRRRVPAHPVHARPRARPTSSARGSTTSARASSRPSLGPVFANLLLADEINRAPAKVQSALLEACRSGR